MGVKIDASSRFSLAVRFGELECLDDAARGSDQGKHRPLSDAMRIPKEGNQFGCVIRRKPGNLKTWRLNVMGLECYFHNTTSTIATRPRRVLYRCIDWQPINHEQSLEIL